MFRYDFSDFYWLYLLIVIVNFLFFLLIYLIYRFFLKSFASFFNNGKLVYFAFISISFGFLAMTTGLLTGTSKSPVVGVIIPSILTFYAGLMTYLFVFSNQDNKIENSISVGISIISMSISLIVGADYGGSMRMKAEFMEKEDTFRRDIQMLDIESRIKEKTLSIESPSNIEDTINTIDQTSPKMSSGPKQ